MKELLKALDELRYISRDPFSLFVAEALRSLGAPIDEKSPTEEEAPHAGAAVAAYLSMVAQEEPFRDLLGRVYIELGSRGHQKWQGQFFTPWDICLMMAQINLQDWKPEPAEGDRLWSVMEPTCGSGTMVLAMMSHLVKQHGPEALLLWHVEATDLDLAVARTCALQILANLTIRGWSIGRCLVFHGNSLSMERFCTVLHATNGEDPEALPRLMGVLRVAEAVARMHALITDGLERLPDPDEPVREVA